MLRCLLAVFLLACADAVQSSSSVAADAKAKSSLLEWVKQQHDLGRGKAAGEAQAILTLVSSMKGKEVPPEVFPLVQQILEFLQAELDTKVQSCASDTGLLSEAQKRVSDTDAVLEPAIAAVQSAAAETNSIQRASEECFLDCKEQGCCETSGAVTAVETVAVNNSHCPPNAAHEYQVGVRARRNFTCDFETQEPEDCWNMLLRSGVQFLEEELDAKYEDWVVDDKECTRIGEERLAHAQASLEKERRCQASTKACWDKRTLAVESASSFKNTLCSGLEAKMRSRCVAVSELAASKTPEVLKADAQRKTEWEQQKTTYCVMFKFNSTKSFDEGFFTQCIPSAGDYEREGCAIGKPSSDVLPKSCGPDASGIKLALVSYERSHADQADLTSFDRETVDVYTTVEGALKDIHGTNLCTAGDEL